MSANAAAPSLEESVAAARTALDAQVREMVRWHFSPETGTPVWLEFARDAGFDPLRDIGGFDDLVARFPSFDGERLRHDPHELWIPRAFRGRPFTIFETGGTTGLPKQRIGWDDYKHDYERFSETLPEESFPRDGYWLMVGPTGPRRLRLAIEHLANFRGSCCYFVDLDPRWVKKLIAAGDGAGAKAYMAHVVEQASTLLRHRKIDVVFTTPRLIEALGEELSLADAGVKGVLCGGTEMSPQTVRFVVEEVLEGRVAFVPVYGNTLMGLAASDPTTLAREFSVTYHAPQPFAALRVTDPKDPRELVDYGARGRVELTTLTRELFLPRFLERDDAIRRPPCAAWPWDGAGEVKPFQEPGTRIIEGVY
jgi:phenylacetate-coenzyme A ligase PaaK-like adenylate-forming protein